MHSRFFFVKIIFYIMVLGVFDVSAMGFFGGPKQDPSIGQINVDMTDTLKDAINSRNLPLYLERLALQKEYNLKVNKETLLSQMAKRLYSDHSNKNVLPDELKEWFAIYNDMKQSDFELHEKSPLDRKVVSHLLLQSFREADRDLFDIIQTNYLIDDYAPAAFDSIQKLLKTECKDEKSMHSRECFFARSMQTNFIIMMSKHQRQIDRKKIASKNREKMLEEMKEQREQREFEEEKERQKKFQKELRSDGSNSSGKESTDLEDNSTVKESQDEESN